MTDDALRPPLPNSYVIPGTRLAAGEYPGSPPGTAAAARDAKLAALLDAGVTVFVDLTEPGDRLAPYAAALQALAARRRVTVTHERFPIVDRGVCAEPHMAAALDAVDAHLAAGRGVYVHGWGGVGRTGTVVGCWLVRHGRSPAAALAEVAERFATMSPAKVRRHAAWGSPQTEAQRRFVRQWSSADPARTATRRAASEGAAARARAGRLAPGRAVGARVRGCLLGTAVGDALGWPVEFESLSRIRARYGPDGIQEFDPRAPGGLGAVTDDTQMTLFTAEGVLRSTTARCADAGAPSDAVVHSPDQIVMWRAYRRWLATQGLRSGPHGAVAESAEPGWLIGVRALHQRRAPGTTCLSALERSLPMDSGDGVLRAGNQSKGCGGVMRVAPIGCVACDDAFTSAAGAAALTHGHPSGYLSAGAYAHMLQAVIHHGVTLRDAARDALDRLARERGHAETTRALGRALALAEASGDPTAERVESLGAGWTGEEALAVGLYCALVARDFAHGVRLAVNHSGDSDSTGSIAGGLLGAAFGEGAIPAAWRGAVELRDELRAVAADLVRGFDPGEAWRARYPAG